MSRNPVVLCLCAVLLICSCQKVSETRSMTPVAREAVQDLSGEYKIAGIRFDGGDVAIAPGSTASQDLLSQIRECGCYGPSLVPLDKPTSFLDFNRIEPVDELEKWSDILLMAPICRSDNYIDREDTICGIMLDHVHFKYKVSADGTITMRIPEGRKMNINLQQNVCMILGISADVLPNTFLLSYYTTMYDYRYHSFVHGEVTVTYIKN